MAEINERLKLIRICSRKSQSEFGKVLNVSPQLISKWECTDFNPSIDDIKNVSKVFSISIEYIINGKANASDKAFLERNLTDEELKTELTLEFMRILSKTDLRKYVDELIKFAKINSAITVQDFKITEKIFFDVKDIVSICDFRLYELLLKKYTIIGYVKFEYLDPNKNSLEFYESALLSDKENIESTFLAYTTDKSKWNDEKILWLINHGAVCVEFVNIDESKHVEYSLDACPDTVITYEPIYRENLVLTFLLKSELERKLNIK